MLFRVRPDIDQVVTTDEADDDDDAWRIDIAEKKRIAALIIESIGGEGGTSSTVVDALAQFCLLREQHEGHHG